MRSGKKKRISISEVDIAGQPAWTFPLEFHCRIQGRGCNRSFHLFYSDLFLIAAENGIIFAHLLSEMLLRPPRQTAIAREQNVQLFEMAVCSF